MLVCFKIIYDVLQFFRTHLLEVAELLLFLGKLDLQLAYYVFIKLHLVLASLESRLQALNLAKKSLLFLIQMSNLFFSQFLLAN